MTEVTSSSSVISEKSYITNLDSDKATLAFLRECVNAMTPYSTVFKGTVENLNTVRNHLFVQSRIDVTLLQCQKKFKRLSESHRRNPSATFNKYLAFLRGESSERPSGEGEDDDCGSGRYAEQQLHNQVLALAKFTKGWCSQTCISIIN